MIVQVRLGILGHTLMLSGLNNLFHVADLVLVGFGQYNGIAGFPVHRERRITFADVVKMGEEDIRALENRIDEVVVREAILSNVMSIR